jgi:hypothetical protein
MRSSDDHAPPPEKCVDCGIPAPASSVDTSMLARLGWRVWHGREPSGRIVVELRCGNCWRKHRASKEPPDEAS